MYYHDSMKRVLLLLALLVLLIQPVFAVDESDATSSSRTPVLKKIKENVERRLEKVEDKMEKRASRASELKDKGRENACKRIEKNIDKRAQKVVEHANKFIEKGDAVVKRVEEFYQGKLVPQGKTLASHDALKSAIDAKKSDVSSASAALTQAASTFVCDTDNPGQSMKSFQENIKSVKEKLQAYKKAVRNFIVAVHQLQGGKLTEPTSTPTLTP